MAIQMMLLRKRQDQEHHRAVSPPPPRFYTARSHPEEEEEDVEWERRFHFRPFFRKLFGIEHENDEEEKNKEEGQHQEKQQEHREHSLSPHQQHHHQPRSDGRTSPAHPSPGRDNKQSSSSKTGAHSHAVLTGMRTVAVVDDNVNKQMNHAVNDGRTSPSYCYRNAAVSADVIPPPPPQYSSPGPPPPPPQYSSPALPPPSTNFFPAPTTPKNNNNNNRPQYTLTPSRLRRDQQPPRPLPFPSQEDDNGQHQQFDHYRDLWEKMKNDNNNNTGEEFVYGRHSPDSRAERNSRAITTSSRRIDTSNQPSGNLYLM